MSLLPIRIENWLSSQINIQDAIEDERKFHEMRIGSSANNISNVTESVLHDMQIIDSKSAALLQFISITIATLTFSVSLFSASWSGVVFKITIYIFIAVFAFAACIDLRCLNIMGPPRMFAFDQAEAYEKAILLEVTKRQSIYFWSLRLTMITFAVLMPASLVGALLWAFGR